MLRALNKIAGSLVAFILYPLKALIVNAGLVALILLLTALSLIAIPILGAISSARDAGEGEKIIAALLGALRHGLIALIVAPIVGSIAIIIIIGTSLGDTIRAMLLGLGDGYENGLFFHVLGRFLFDTRLFSSSLLTASLYINTIGAGGSDTLDEDALAQLAGDDDVDYTTLTDVPRSPNALPNINESEVSRTKFAPLSNEELDLAGTIGELSDTLEAYTDLHQRLTALDADIKQRNETGGLHDDLAEVSDELFIYVGIQQPALLVKQYQDEKGRWRAIPGRTKIIDRASIEKWLTENSNSHPATREPLDNANPHRIDGVERPARYRLVNYTHMDNAQELIEASHVIRKKLEQANPANIQVGRVVDGVSAYLETTGLFGGGHTPDRTNDAQPEQGRDLPYS